MSTTSVIRRLAAASAITAGALLTTLAVATMSFGTPALATSAVAEDSVKVDLNGVSNTMIAGLGIGDPISATFENNTNNPITSVRAVFTIHLAGMPSDGVQIVRTLGSALPADSAGDGTVRLSDPNTFELLRNNRRTNSYVVKFTSSAPSGKASITLEAYQGDTRLGGDSASVTVKGSATAQTTSAPNTNPGVIPTFAAGTSYAIATLPADEAASGDVPVSLYVMGALLVGVGGVILWLLFRRQKPLADVGAYPTAEHDQIRPATLGYPRHAAITHPTAVLPTVRDAEPPAPPGPSPRPTRPGPGSIPRDPWA